MNPIEALQRDVERSLPSTWTRVRVPRNPKGMWWLDAKNGDHLVSVQWSPTRGFGVSASALPEAYGEGPEETFESAEAASARVLELLRNEEHTSPPREVVLREVRALLGFTQEQLAERLGVQQAAVSRLERRDDMTLSSLRRYVAALGASLEITVRTESGETIRIAPPGDARNHAACTHVEDRLAMTGDDRVPRGPDDSLEWLEEVDAVFLRIWPAGNPDFALRTDGSGPLAETRPRDGTIVLDMRKAVALSREIDAGGITMDPACGSGKTLGAVLRYLAAHERGHLLPSEGWASLHAPRELAHPELLADYAAGYVAAQIGDDAAVGAALASRLGCRMPGCTHPAPERRAAAYLAGYAATFRERTTIVDHRGATARADTGPHGSVSLLVIRSSDVERSRGFYSQLGLALRPEKHGSGPLHYSCDLTDTIFEIYPATIRRPPMDGLRIGLRVSSVAAAIERLLSAGFLNERPRVVERDTGASVCVVRDPDGTTVELQAQSARYRAAMAVRATVRNGRLTLGEPTELPEGTVIDLVIDDEGDDLDAEQRRALDSAIDRSLEQAKNGQTASADAILAKLRSRRAG